ncbi:zf-HC2 domain-containing protein [bacterium]|nr:zf-HC2 domain-containing protein [bacterium]
MNHSECKKIEAMLCSYIEHKLSDEEMCYVENHFAKCPECYQKYLEMKEIIGNLHYEYVKLMKELDKIEENKIFNLKEYDNFYQNISPYIDDELSYDDSIKFRKYILKSKPARTKLSDAYGLKNNIKNSINSYKDGLKNINFSKNIIKRLKNKPPLNLKAIYSKSMVFLGFLISIFAILSIYLGFNYLNEYYTGGAAPSKLVEKINIPNEDEMVEFTFDDDNNPLITAK